MNRRKLIYTTPSVVTIAVLPAWASPGSDPLPQRDALCFGSNVPKHGCKHYLRELVTRGLGRPEHRHN